MFTDPHVGHEFLVQGLLEEVWVHVGHGAEQLGRECANADRQVADRPANLGERVVHETHLFLTVSDWHNTAKQKQNKTGQMVKLHNLISILNEWDSTFQHTCGTEPRRFSEQNA